MENIKARGQTRGIGLVASETGVDTVSAAATVPATITIPAKGKRLIRQRTSSPTGDSG
ncbi:MAG: hypothetical protein ACM3JB_03625 [Acidobacteriaceae bacterium]